MPRASEADLDLLFRKARTRNGWSDEPVSEVLLREIYDLAKMGPTTANSQPFRIVFAASAAAKKKLEPALDEGNRAKTMQAPVVALFATDTRFYENLPKTMPHNPAARSWFEGPEKAASTAEAGFRNATLQCAYFMLAARALGLDCGPMSGFDPAAVNAAFFPDGRYLVNFICALGHGTDEKLFGRSPRLGFDDVAKVV